jgi:glycosyl transferase family 9 (putative heptosyltransferase)
VIHPGALGDVLLAVPALRALRGGGARVTLAAQPRIGALLVALGIADRTVSFDALGLEALFGDAPLAPDVPLAHALRDTSRVVCWFGARDEQFARRLRALAPNAVVAPPSASTGPVWRHLLDTVSADADAQCQPLVLRPGDADDGRRALRAIGWDGRSRVLVAHPGAGGVAKRWPVDGFVDVVRELDATVVVHQGPADAEGVRTFTERVRRPVLRLVDPQLPTLAGVLASASAYLGNDSGVSHLAAAVGAPAVVLFTDAARPWRPWSPTARCLTVSTRTLVRDECRVVGAAVRELI